MRLWHQDGEHWRLVKSPADIRQADKVLRIEGHIEGRDLARWAPALGVFVASGGDIRRLDV